MYLEKTNLKRFVAALFTIAKTRKQPKFPSTDEQIKKTYIYIYIHIHTMESYSAIKNEIMPFSATWMDGPRDYYTK